MADVSADTLEAAVERLEAELQKRERGALASAQHKSRGNSKTVEELYAEELEFATLAYVKATDLRPLLSALQAQQADAVRMREALEPFAKYADATGDRSNPIVCGCSGPGGRVAVHMADFRRARAILNPES